MKRNYLGLVLLLAVMTIRATGTDLAPGMQPKATNGLFSANTTARAAEQAAYRKWKMSLTPVFASQALDVASSYGMRELNPLLTSSDQRFGAKGAGIKLGATAAILGIEYLIVRKHTRAASIFTKINWSVSIMTAGFAAHNYAIR